MNILQMGQNSDDPRAQDWEDDDDEEGQAQCQPQ